MHDCCPDLKVKVFGFLPSADFLDEIVLWRRVQFIDISKEVFYSTTDTNLANETLILNEILVWHLFEHVFEEDDDAEVVYIKTGYLYDKDLGSSNSVIGPDGQYQIYSRGSGYEQFIKPKLMKFRGQKPNNNLVQEIHPKMSGYQLRRAQKEYSCAIHVRKELAFSKLLERSALSTDYPVNILANSPIAGSSVALLVPSKNSLGRVEDCALVKYLLTSLLDTVQDESVSVIIYVGYDRNDPILSDFRNKKLIESFIKSRFQIKFIELPHSGWLTFIWNVLFIEAYNDPIGNSHFVQLNDDVRFASRGWLTGSLNLMNSDPVIRVMGFNDAMWQCKLYTQSLVDRRHYTSYNGHYFPLELCNWYSDNWITTIPHGKCNQHAKITNGNVETRYEKCSDREYKKLLGEGAGCINK